MRPPKREQSRVLQPLNAILGTHSNVRLIRTLSLCSTPLTAGELARRADLGRTSIFPALRELEFIGIVEFVGAGAQRQIQLRDRHPLAPMLKELFRAEANRFDELTTALRELFVKSPVRVLSAWVEDAAALPSSTDAVRLYFVAMPEDKETLSDYLNEHLPVVERAQDLHVVVTGLTRSELETLARSQGNALDNPTLLGGVPPLGLLRAETAGAAKPTAVSHAEQDARARKLALAIAVKIKRDPGLIQLAENRLERRSQRASPRERRELREWLRVLSTMSPARLRAFLIEDSERATRLRQSLPALSLLSVAERQAVLRSRTDEDVIAAVTRR
jgi:DNA-binding phage protein